LLIDEADARHITDMYDAGIRSVDASVGVFLAYLKTLGLYDESLIVVTSDHGEELGERGRHGWHSHALFDEQIRVPLMVKLPRAKLRGTRVAAQVRLIDILPTILDVLGLNLSASFEGSSLLGLARGARESSTRLAVSERDVTDSVLPAILRSLDWKYENRAQESQALLFDLRADPGENTNVLSQNEDVALKMKLELEAIVGSRPMPVGPSSTFEGLSDSLTEQLRSLGYLTETLEDR
jgi:arylsulfatase A-like enzyme